MNILARRANSYAFIAFAILTLAGCQQSDHSSFSASGQQWVRTELFFGMNKPAGGRVSDDEWETFLNTSVTPRFPKGLTVLRAEGRYRNHDMTFEEEPSRVLVLVHSDGGDDSNDKINDLVGDYLRKFEQESVLRIDSPARATFLNDSRVRTPM